MYEIEKSIQNQIKLLQSKGEFPFHFCFVVLFFKIGKSNFKEPGVPEPIFKVGNKHRGTHKTCDGIISDQYDYQLKNGLITNCLCVYYLMWYRLAICKQDWDKIKDLQRFYGRSQAQLQNMFDNKKLY